MATIEKLIKAFEALKVFQANSSGVEDTAKKKDQPIGKKEKITNCNVVADCICAPNMRSITDFPKFLGIAMETYLTLCDDIESDVRMVADECLNRSIKVLLETNLGRLQVELYKEIKKNGTPRSLRAALWRFADMAHLIRPQKCRPYIVNLLPCLSRICQRDGEAIQETLLISMQKICPALMGFANESEVKALIKAFLPNLRSSQASCRRTAAHSLTLICQNSRSPTLFANYLLELLLGQVLPVDTEHDVYILLGVILCLRHIFPHLANPNTKDQGMKGSFGVMTKEREEPASTERLMQIYQLLLYYMGHFDHNVVTASLEALHQLLRNPSHNLYKFLTTKGAVNKTLIYQKDLEGSPHRVRTLAEVPSVVSLSDDMGLDEDSDMSEVASQSIGSASETSAFVSDFETSSSDQSSLNRQQCNEQGLNNNSDVQPEENNPSQCITFTTNMEYSSVEIGDLNEDRSEKSNLSQTCSSSQETLLSIKSLSPKRRPSLHRGVSQDLNGNPELEEINFTDYLEPSAVTNTDDSFQIIGSIVNEDIPLKYCVRLICRRFLLSGSKQCVISDQKVRVSLKVLSLLCLTSAFNISPEMFLGKVSMDEADAKSQDVVDICQFSSHSDPQLKGNIAILLGVLIHSALQQGSGDFLAWLKQNQKAKDFISLDFMVQTVLGVLDDSSFVAVRLALMALRLCLDDMLKSIHSDTALRVLLKFLEIKNNPYWLVKVELLELISSINYTIVHYLETICVHVQRGSNHYLAKMNLQEKFLSSIVLIFLGDEDARVRHAAALCFVNLVPNFFYPIDHPQQDSVIALAKEKTDTFFSPIIHEWGQDPPPLVQGLVQPYHLPLGPITDANLESNVSRIVKMLLFQLYMSQSKYSTYGCCHALSLLSESYTSTCYSHAWGCGPPTSLIPKEVSSQKNKRPPNRSISSSSTFSLDDLDAGSGGGPLPIVLSLLTSSEVALDLAAHQDALQLAGNLVAGAAYRSLRATDEFPGTSGTSSDDIKWASVSDRILVPLMDQLLMHITRLLNAFAHVIDEQIPSAPQLKASLPSLPNAPSLSPIKRKARGEKEPPQGTPGSTTPDSKGSQKQSQKEKEKDQEKERNKKDGLGTFYSIPQYMKVFESLRSAYASYKISLDLNMSDKFCTLLQTTLKVFSQLLEIALLQDVVKYAEEFLGYLRTTIILEPTTTILCVQQLLKALFGTNLASQWELQQVPNSSHKPGKATRLSTTLRSGLYHCCFSVPYSHFTQSLAGAAIKATTQMEQEESSILTWLRKCVERKVPAILKPSSKADKTAIGSYIRLFEPLVIKALKQYTVTSSLELQLQVLDLLSQLVQLRVNYCLLDSDLVFIGFVIKQFEYIEEGQIRNSEIIIPHIFNFLVMLSYEKYHSKSIISMPKIIQLCDGIMASGLNPTTHAIAAVQTIVHDLFLLRGASKTDISKDLETQREVLVSMLLRLIQYYQALDMFVIVLQQCHRESEERWKRLSRQVIDVVLPVMGRQQINLDSQVALDVLHHLFESVTTSVFRPVDILLKTLLSTPVSTLSVQSLRRWLCMVLGILRVLMAQSKEEVILSRLQELGLKLTLFKSSCQDEDASKQISELASDDVLAWFLLQIVGTVSATICSYSTGIDASIGSCDFLPQQLAHLLLYITHMFQSGLFRKVATSAMRITRQETPACFYGIKEINSNFLLFGVMYPTLTLQWCNILILLNFDDQSLWSSVMQTPPKYVMAGSGQGTTSKKTEKPQRQCLNLELLRQGGLVLFCDFVCENLNDAEHMTWLIINHVSDLIELSQESPVQDFISAIHRNPAASSLFIQAIHARCENVSKASLVKKTLKCVEPVHVSQSGALLTLLIDKFLHTHNLSVSRICDLIACRRVEMLLAETSEEISNQLPLEDLLKLLQFMKSNGLYKRHERLVSLLVKLEGLLSTEGRIHMSPVKSHPLSVPTLDVTSLEVSKELFLSIIKEQCFSSDASPRECAHLLQTLDYADILSLTMTKEFNLTILEECLKLGTFRTQLNFYREKDTIDSEGNNLMTEPSFDSLFQAAQLTLIRHINNIINMLPYPHQCTDFSETSDIRNRHYSDQMEEVLSDSSWIEMVSNLTAALLQYLTGMASFPWQPQILSENQKDICRFCVLSLEILSWTFHHNQIPSSDQLETSIQCLSMVLQNPLLSTMLGQKELSSWACTITSSVYQIFMSLVVLPEEHLSLLPQQNHPRQQVSQNSLDLKYMVRTCDHICDLVHCLNTRLNPGPTQQPCLPQFVSTPLRNIIIGLARLPTLNSYARTPPIVWKMGWVPAVGQSDSRLPPLPVEYLQDKEVLTDFVARVNTLGWINRQQFEETWMSLLGVLNPVGNPRDGNLSVEEEIERSQCMVLAVKTITSLLTQSLLTPVPGNPSNSHFHIRPRDKPLGFLYTRCGKKLTVIRGIIEQEVQNLCSERSDQLLYNPGREDRDLLKYMFDYNLERELGTDNYMLGQLCIEEIWSVVGVLDMNLSESDTTDSMDSPQDTSKVPPIHQASMGVVTSKERALTSSGLDINSCLQFLLELYGQWLSPTASPKPPLMLRNEIVKSVLCLSDLFMEREQHEWMLDTLLDVQKSHPIEDELFLQHLIVGICKGASVIGVESAAGERLCKAVDGGLKSTHLSSRIATLHGILYLLEAGMSEITKTVVPMTTDFLLRNITIVSQPCITSQQYILTMWATAFYIMENYHVELRDVEFPSQILQMAVSTASGSEDSVSTPVYLAILKGLERLLLTDVLSQQDAEAIMKLSVDRLCLPSPQRSLAGLGLMFTCMYSGKQNDQYSPRPRDQDPSESAFEDFEVIHQDPESLIMAMERVTVLFDRIKKGYPYEARVITRVLPAFLADFFPPQDIMNKVIGEFISSQQPYPQLISKLVFQVFSNLHSQRQFGLVRDWVMLSLSNFMQRTPVAMAMWSLTCFFISASVNQWMRALFPHALGRMGKMEEVDRKLFCLAALDFYRQLTEDSQKRAFHSTFQAITVPDSPYQELLNCLVL
ncbi:hypothetical protein ScPMuIL_001750 [Solemya velum]